MSTQSPRHELAVTGWTAIELTWGPSRRPYLVNGVTTTPLLPKVESRVPSAL